MEQSQESYPNIPKKESIVNNAALNLCPECQLLYVEEWHELSGLVPEKYYTCTNGHCWTDQKLED